ncbi:hypothetical protein AAAT94_08400 [Intestinimonas aquisgranensis]|nr:hypothetical protein [Intestinimonas aquisgranensis]
MFDIIEFIILAEDKNILRENGGEKCKTDYIRTHLNENWNQEQRRREGQRQNMGKHNMEHSDFP